MMNLGFYLVFGGYEIRVTQDVVGLAAVKVHHISSSFLLLFNLQCC